ncbi:hypothetical protein BN1013_01596 [Candidatus Rubidus massiliensis]|nr:hypothetical protein BN1013_01596 [Candidatus Rubidus massiliensis]
MINLNSFNYFKINSDLCSRNAISELSSYYNAIINQIREDSTLFENNFQEKNIQFVNIDKSNKKTTYSLASQRPTNTSLIYKQLSEIGIHNNILDLFVNTYFIYNNELKLAYEATPEEIEQAEEFYTYNDKEQLIPLTKKEIELVKVIHKIYYVEFILKPYIIDLKRLQELENKKSLTSETPKEEKERVKFIPLKTPIEREDKQTSNVPPYLIILIDLLTLQRFLIEKYKQLVQEYNKIEKQNEVVEKDIQRSDLKREIIKAETLKREITISEKFSKLKK